MTPPATDNHAAAPDPDLAASCRVAIAAADRERNPLAMLALAILFGLLVFSGATVAWLRLRVVPAVAAPMTLITVLAPPPKLIAKTAPPTPAPPAPAPAAPKGNSSR